jgi:hypothetical protein
MAILVDAVRAERCVAKPTPSVREVCLVGISRPGSGWGRGDRVTFSGRAYRVKATRARSGREDEAPRYVHLSGDEEMD